MNELLAIIIIVLICCAMFFAWLISMATCPDRMVNLISGTSNRPQSSTTSSMSSKELSSSTKFTQNNIENKQTTLTKPMNRSNSKKLSVVPEQDEQLTVTSISQCLRTPQKTNNNNTNNNYFTQKTPLLNPHNEEDEDIIEKETKIIEERCVEDVILARKLFLYQTMEMGENPDNLTLVSWNSEFDHKTADISPVPSRCETPLTQPQNVILPPTSSAPAIIQVV